MESFKGSTTYSDEMNKQYSPSFWSKRYPQPIVVDKHVQAVTEVSELNRTLIPHVSNIKYGSNESWVMDDYGSTLPQDSPIFVYIHGGYWQSLNKDVSSYPVKPFFKAGIKVIVPDYTLAPEASLTEIVEQIRKLAEYVLKEAKNTGSRSVWFGGHSAGAHLAASLLDHEWCLSLDTSLRTIFSGLVLISGLYNLTPVISTEYNVPLKLTESLAKSLSPINKDLHWSKKLKHNFTVILAVGGNESPQFQHQTILYYEHLKTQVKSEYLFLIDLDHFDIVENLQNDEYFLTKTIIKIIRKNENDL